jgi:hypothetical protein
LQNSFGFFRGIPESFLSNQVFDFLKPFFFDGQVKDSPVAVLISEKDP